jgi:hypothetical protein
MSSIPSMPPEAYARLHTHPAQSLAVLLERRPDLVGLDPRGAVMAWLAAGQVSAA